MSGAVVETSDGVAALPSQLKALVGTVAGCQVCSCMHIVEQLKLVLMINTSRKSGFQVYYLVLDLRTFLQLGHELSCPSLIKKRRKNKLCLCWR